MSDPTAGRQLRQLGDGIPPHSLAFVSYARESEAVAVSICEELEQAGIQTWIDREQLGEDPHSLLISERIWNALGEATDVVAIVCGRSVHKPWVVHEWQTAAARWLATGSPKIHVVMVDKGFELPSLPFTTLHEYSHDVAFNIARAITQPEGSQAPVSEAQWGERIRRWRAEFLMGGPTAVRALHQFAALWPSFRAMIDACVAREFVDSDIPASFLAWLGPVLDLRVSRGWLCHALASACRAPIAHRTRGILSNNLGVALLYGGQFTKAAASFEMSAHECRAEDDSSGLATAIGNQALLSLELGQIARMHDWIGQARRAIERARARPGADTERETLQSESLLQSHEARGLLYEGRYAEARTAFLEQLGLAEALESRRLIGVSLGYVALTDILSGAPTAATTRWLDRYRCISLASLNLGGIANSLHWAAIGSYSCGAASEALQLIDQEILLRLHRDEQPTLRRAIAWKNIVTLTAGLQSAGELPVDVVERVFSEPEKSEADATLFARAGLGRKGAPMASGPSSIHPATADYLARMATQYEPRCNPK